MVRKLNLGERVECGVNLQLRFDDGRWPLTDVFQNSYTRKAPRRSALLAGLVMAGWGPKAPTTIGLATKRAARQPRKRPKARPMSEYRASSPFSLVSAPMRTP